MEQENNTNIINESTTAEVKEAVTVDTMDSVKMAEKLKELEGFNARLLQENKELKTTPVEKTKETKTETVTESSSLPLRDIAMIAELSKVYSIEELEKAQEFVGGPLGKTLNEVAANVGFKAVIAKDREEKLSNNMIDTTDIDLKPIETKDSIIRDIESGVIDYKAPGNEKYREIYVKYKASQME